MADKSFGVKELNLLNASGTPTVTSPNNLNLNANTVAISTSCTIGNNLTVTSTTNSANLNVTGIGTLTRAFATDLSVSGVTTITVPSNANPHSSWDVVNNGSSAYRFTGPGQDGAEDNPNIYLVRGQRYVFKMNASGHPFQIRVANGGAAYSDGVTNNGSQTGNVVFNVQHDAPAQLFYQCTSHGSMVGNIYIVGGPQVISGVVTATTFSGSGANLTNLPAANLTGTLPAIDGSNLTGLSGVSLANGSNNRVVTATGASGLNGEAGLTFDGSNFNFSRQDAGDARMYIYGGEGGDARLLLGADEGDDHIDTYEFRSQASDNALVLYQFESGAYRNRMEFETGGNIGINRTNPSSLLHIQGNDTSTYNINSAVTNGILTISSDAGGGVGKCVGLQFNGPCSNGEGYITMVGISNSEMDMHFGMRSGGNRADKVIFSSNGRVRCPAVYSTNGSNMRDVQIESDGTLCAGNTSVRASKLNITSQTDISWLYDLNPVTFNYRKKIVDKVTGIPTYFDEAESETSYGLIAEEVETVKKDFCFYNKDKLEGVHYNRLITPLLKAIQDQKKEIDDLKAEVAALKGS